MEPRSTFVQDFVSVERSFASVLSVARDLIDDDVLSRLFGAAWATQSVAADRDARCEVGTGHEAGDDGVIARMSSPRTRSARLVVPVVWTLDVGPSARPLLDADLEFARFGARRTHLTLTGRAPHGATARSPRVPTDRSEPDRLMLAAVRHFLTALSAELTSAADRRARDSARAPTGSSSVTAPEARSDAMMGG